MRLSRLGLLTSLAGGGTMDPNASAWLAAPSPANLATALDQGVAEQGHTGSGKVVLNNTPTLLTPKYQDQSAAWTYNLTPSTLAANRAITLPALAADDTFAFIAATQTLTNKTLDSTNAIAGAAITSGVIATARGGFGQSMAAATGITQWTAGTPALLSVSGSGNVVLDTSPTLTTPIVQTTSGAVNTVGMVSQTTVAAVNGTQSSSPLNYLRGFGFDTVAVASKPVDFGWEVDPTQTAGNPTGSLKLFFRTNNGAWTNPISISSGGSFTAASTIASSAGGVTAATTMTAGTGLTVTTGNAQASSGAFLAFKNGIGVATTPGLNLINQSAAALGAQQWSPSAEWRGFFWNTTGGASEQVSWFAEVQTTQATDATSSNLVFSRTASSVNGGAKTSLFTFASSGSLTVASQIVASGTITGSNLIATSAITASAGVITARRDNITTVNAQGFSANNATLSTVSVTVQQSPDYYWNSSAWNSLGAVAEANEWRAYVLPSTAAGTTASVLTFQRQIAGGGYATTFQLSSSGSGTFTGSLTVNAAITAGTTISTSAGAITANRLAIAAVSTQGITVNNSTAALVGVQNQWSPYFEAGGRVWDGSASQQARWKHEVQTTAGASYRGDYVFTYTDGGGALEYMRLMGRTPGLTIGSATAIPAGGTAGFGLMMSSTANWGVFGGSGAPTLSAAKGSLYLRSNGTGVADRIYVNTDGGTTWTNLVTAA